eukprot:SAG25_NODE_2154_length_1890_cov_1.211614_2_plen_152_part_00
MRQLRPHAGSIVPTTVTVRFERQHDGSVVVNCNSARCNTWGGHRGDGGDRGDAQHSLFLSRSMRGFSAATTAATRSHCGRVLALHRARYSTIVAQIYGNTYQVRTAPEQQELQFWEFNCRSSRKWNFSPACMLRIACCCWLAAAGWPAADS